MVAAITGLLLWFGMGLAFAAQEMGTVNTSKESVAKIQAYIESMKNKTPSIEEIAIYATLADGNTMRIACTELNKVGHPADPEDIDAIIENKVVIIEEGEVLDVTIPMVNTEGLPAAVAGIKVALGKNMTKDSAKEQALAMAKEIDVMLTAQ